MLFQSSIDNFVELPAGNLQPPTCDVQLAACNLDVALWILRLTFWCSVQRASRNNEHATTSPVSPLFVSSISVFAGSGSFFFAIGWKRTFFWDKLEGFAVFRTETLVMSIERFWSFAVVLEVWRSKVQNPCIAITKQSIQELKYLRSSCLR